MTHFLLILLPLRPRLPPWLYNILLLGSKWGVARQRPGIETNSNGTRFLDYGGRSIEAGGRGSFSPGDGLSWREACMSAGLQLSS